MKKSDEDVVRARPAAYRAALSAAAMRLRQDRRLLGIPNLREKIAELGALSALTGEAHSIGKSVLERMPPENVELYVEALEMATIAARATMTTEAAP